MPGAGELLILTCSSSQWAVITTIAVGRGKSAASDCIKCVSSRWFISPNSGIGPPPWGTNTTGINALIMKLPIACDAELEVNGCRSRRFIMFAHRLVNRRGHNNAAAKQRTPIGIGVQHRNLITHGIDGLQTRHQTNGFSL